MSEAIGTREFAKKYGVPMVTVFKWCREGKSDIGKEQLWNKNYLTHSPLP